ncbi:MAG: hypothetical protein COA47_17790 [Robiginitomaculum sp.]|nr:MAG: hypothetical protein COA47_17790 [Robiginitomaculum sp.]
MKYKTTAGVAIILHSPEIDVSTILDPIKNKLERSHKKGEKKIPDGDVSYHDYMARFCLRERSVFDIGTELMSICTKLIKLKTIFDKINNKPGGSIWIIVRLYDPEYILFNIEQPVIHLLDRLGVGFSIENRA